MLKRLRVAALGLLLLTTLLNAAPSRGAADHFCAVAYLPPPTFELDWGGPRYENVCELDGTIGFNGIIFGWAAGATGSIRLHLHDGPTVLAIIHCDLIAGIGYCGMEQKPGSPPNTFSYYPYSESLFQVGVTFPNLTKVLGLSFLISPYPVGVCSGTIPPLSSCVNAGAGYFQLTFF